MLYTGETPIHAIKYNQMNFMVMNYSGLMNFFFKCGVNVLF